MGNISGVQYRPQGIIPRDSSLQMQFQPLPNVPGSPPGSGLPQLIILPTDLGVVNAIVEGEFNHLVEVTNSTGTFPIPTVLSVSSSDPTIASVRLQFASISGHALFFGSRAGQTYSIPQGASGVSNIGVFAMKPGTCTITASAPGYASVSMAVKVTALPRDVPVGASSGFKTTFIGEVTIYGKSSKKFTTIQFTNSSPLSDFTTITSAFPETLGVQTFSFWINFFNNCSLGNSENLTWTLTGASFVSAIRFAASGAGSYVGRPSSGIAPNPGAAQSCLVLCPANFDPVGSPLATGQSITLTSSYQPFDPTLAMDGGGLVTGLGAITTLDTFTFQVT